MNFTSDDIFHKIFLWSTKIIRGKNLRNKARGKIHDEIAICAWIEYRIFTCFIGTPKIRWFLRHNVFSIVFIEDGKTWNFETYVLILSWLNTWFHFHQGKNKRNKISILSFMRPLRVPPCQIWISKISTHLLALLTRFSERDSSKKKKRDSPVFSSKNSSSCNDTYVTTTRDDEWNTVHRPMWTKSWNNDTTFYSNKKENE